MRTNNHDKLIAAVMRHSGLSAEEIIEASRFGADQGWSGFTYNDDAAAFFDEHQELIWEVLCDENAENGDANAVQMLAGFNRIDMASSFMGLKVLLAWYALERAGQAIEC